MKSIMRYKNEGNRQILIVLEPWCTEYQVDPGITIDLMALTDEPLDSFDIHSFDDGLIIWVEGPKLVEFYKDGVEFESFGYVDWHHRLTKSTQTENDVKD